MSERDPKKDPHSLIDRAKQGDQAAFGEFYQEFFTPLYRYVYHRVGRKEDAEDITQNVFLRVYQSLPRYEDRGISPLAYCFSVARNAVVDHWRKKKDILAGDGSEAVFAVSGSSNAEEFLLDRIWSREMVAEGISFLTPLEADAVTLRYLHDLSNVDIALILEKSEEAVRQLQSRGLRKMRRNFGNEV